MKKIALFLIFILISSSAFSETSTKIEDRTVSGNKVDVEKIGSAYAIVESPVRVSSATVNQISCGVTSGAIVSANANRAVVTWVNHSSTAVFVCLSSTCTTTTGISFAQNTGYIAEHYTGAVSCITSSGTATVGYYEQ